MRFDPVDPAELEEVGAYDFAKRMESEGWTAVEVQGDDHNIFIVFVKPKEEVRRE